MTVEQVTGEYTEGAKPIGRLHDVPNGSVVILVGAENQETLSAYIIE